VPGRRIIVNVQLGLLQNETEIRKDLKMDRSAKKVLFLTAVIISSVIWFAGCNEENKSAGGSAASSDTGDKKGRLIASQLKTEIEQKDKTIADNKAEIEKQKGMLEQCQKEKMGLEADIQKGIAEKVESILSIVMDENARLKSESEQLKKSAPPAAK